MNRKVIERLALPAMMAGFLVRHLVINRNWFKQLWRGQYDVRRLVVLVLHVALAINMVVLFVTSVIISRTVFSALSLPSIPFLREIHWFSAYWLIVIVGIHLGTHWHRVLSLGRPVLDTLPAGVRPFILRALALSAAAYGLWTFGVLGVGNKLTFTYSLEFWDFTSSVTPFFAHWIGVLCLFGVTTHYSLSVLKAVKRRAR